MSLNLDNVNKLREQFRSAGGTAPAPGAAGYSNLLNPTTAAGTITVGVVATKILDVNEGRFYAVIVNDSAQAIYIAFSPNPVLNRGIRINANGGTLVIGLSGDIPHLGVVYAIAAAPSVVTVVES